MPVIKALLDIYQLRGFLLSLDFTLDHLNAQGLWWEVFSFSTSLMMTFWGFIGLNSTSTRASVSHLSHRNILRKDALTYETTSYRPTNLKTHREHPSILAYREPKHKSIKGSLFPHASSTTNGNMKLWRSSSGEPRKMKYWSQ